MIHCKTTVCLGKENICKNCIKADVCKIAEEFDKESVDGIYIEKCGHFKDRNQFIDLSYEIGNIVYVITNCCNIYTHNDYDYFTGTGTTKCPFANNCNFEECDDTNERIFEAKVSSIYNEGNGWCLVFKDLAVEFNITDIGKTVFLTQEEAEQALKERENNG